MRRVDPPSSGLPPGALRQWAAVESRPHRLPIPLGTAIDRVLPGGGLARAALHEVAGAGPEVEHASGAALFAAAVLSVAAVQNMVLWIAATPDVHGPALAAVGLHPDRVIYAEARRPACVLLAMEDALRHAGLAGVVGELSGQLSLTASRRLHLAAEAAGLPALLLRRSRRFDDPALTQPCAAVTRWRIGSLPAAAPLPDAPWVPGVGPLRWRLDLVRCRGGEPASWIVEAPDAQGRLGVPADMADRSAAPPRHRRAA